RPGCVALEEWPLERYLAPFHPPRRLRDPRGRLGGVLGGARTRRAPPGPGDTSAFERPDTTDFSPGPTPAAPAALGGADAAAGRAGDAGLLRHRHGVAGSLGDRALAGGGAGHRGADAERLHGRLRGGAAGLRPALR